MDSKYQYMIDAVPENQREELKRRIEWMEVNGFKHIGLWTDVSFVDEDGTVHEASPPDITDLVGVPPNSQLVEFVAPKIDPK
jgi:hypothetical protein